MESKFPQKEENFPPQDLNQLIMTALGEIVIKENLNLQKVKSVSSDFSIVEKSVYVKIQF